MYEEFIGKSVLVTGASRGIGAATAIAFAKNGARKVTVHYGTYQEGADATVAAIRETGAESEAIQADLGTEEGIQGFVKALSAQGPHFDILINNAGSLVKRASLYEWTPALYDQVMNLNVKSVLFITQCVVPHMAAQESGCIVNLSSIAARNGGGPGAMMYSAAKAAVACMTKGLAKELARKGIRVNAVSPGTVDNHFHEVFSNAQILENMVKQTPAGKLGTNEEVADTILFLCSEQSRFIYGQTVEINGGMYMV